MDSKTYTDKEYSGLKPCPFCGAIPVIRKTPVSTASNRRGTVPEGAEIIEKWTDRTGHERVSWKRYGYTVHCMTKACYCRAGNAKFSTEEKAIETWNHRAKV